MSQKREIKSWLIRYGVGTALAIGVGGTFVKWTDFKPNLVNPSYDLLFLPRDVVEPTELVMVWLDDDSHRELEQPYNLSWDRALHARLLERLTAEGARAGVFDILFPDPNP